MSGAPCPGWQDEEYDCTPDSPCTSCWHSGRYSEPECNGICLSAADIGVPEAGDVIAYAHPDCPAHGDPLEEDPAADTCGGGDESLRLVHEEDVAGVTRS